MYRTQLTYNIILGSACPCSAVPWVFKTATTTKMYCKLGGLWVSYHAEIFPKAASVDKIAEICIYLVLRTSRLTMRMTCYRIAGNFHGRKLPIIGGKKLFAEKTFVDCLLVPPKYTMPPNFAKKIFTNSYKTSNLQKVSPSKVSHYTVWSKRKLKQLALPRVESRTADLSWHCSTTVLRQPDNHQLS